MGRKDKPSDQLHVGAKLRHARQSQAITLSQMAERLSYSKGYLSAVENGHRRPSPDVVTGYRDALGPRLFEQLGRDESFVAARIERAAPIVPEHRGAWGHGATMGDRAPAALGPDKSDTQLHGRLTPTARRHYSSLILRHLVYYDGLTKAKLSQLTGLSPTVVGGILRRELADLIIEADPAQSGARPSSFVCLNKDAFSILSIDLGRLRTRLALTNLRAEPIPLRSKDLPSMPISPREGWSGSYDPELEAGLVSVATPTDKFAAREEILAWLYWAVAQTLQAYRMQGMPPLLAVGIGAPGPGPVDGTLWKPANMPGFHNIPIRDPLARYLEVPVIVENDADALAMIWHLLLLPDQPYMAVLTATQGIGSGIIFGGELLRAPNGLVGEVGLGSLGVAGHGQEARIVSNLESKATTTATIKRYNAMTGEHRRLQGRDDACIRELCRRAREDGDGSAQEAIYETACWLATAVVSVCYAYNSRVVVVDSPMLAAPDAFFLNPIKKAVKMMVDLPVEVRSNDLRRGLSPLSGGACLVLDKLLGGGWDDGGGLLDTLLSITRIRGG